jgi:rRNA maturation endonuclease Nob1
MQIIGAEWTSVVNMLLIQCGCGARFKHRADRQHIRCKSCGSYANLHQLRETTP